MNHFLYAFILGREYRLSLAELIHIFGQDALTYQSETLAIFSLPDKLSGNFLTRLGGSTRIIELISETSPATFPTDTIAYIEEHIPHGKLTFALANFGMDLPLSEIGMRMKKTLSAHFSVRFLNAKNGNIHSAVFKREKLGKTQTEFAIIKTSPWMGVEGWKNVSTLRQSSGWQISQKNNPLDTGGSHEVAGGFWNEFTSVNEWENFEGNEEIWSFSQKNNTPLPPFQGGQATEKYFLGKTIACQDIDAYARRDTGKSRDMIVGMMPPKLVQMMINMVTSPLTPLLKERGTEKKSEKTLSVRANSKTKQDQKEIWSFVTDFAVYDPFCGLGTTLIEAANMGIYSLFGSDISVEMVENSRASLDDFIETERTWQERIKNAGGTPSKDFSHITSEIFHLDATQIERAFSEYGVPKSAHIISEGFLGKIMRKHEITQDIVLSERRSITRLYDAFFAGLKKAGFTGNIVMSFPFWKVHNVYIYMDEITEILAKYGFRTESLLPREMNLNTKNGSLLYRRESQNVGREIIKIVRK